MTLALLKSAAGPELERLLAGISSLELAPGQEAFVGEPAAMVETAMADGARHPFALVADPPPATPAPAAGAAVPQGPAGAVVGMGVLHLGAATDAGWPDAHDAVLLRGFLVDRHCQGRGYGTRATVAAVGLARVLALALPARGVVLGVNERNQGGLAAYLRAGFVDRGRYLGGRSGPQRTLYRKFVNQD